MIIRSACVACLALGLLGMPGGCSSGPRYDDPESNVGLELQPSTKNLVAGEVATVFARTEDVYGRNAQIEWETTGGELETLENGRVARVHFNRPGTYTVTARLMVDGREVRRDAVNINVKPLT